MNSMSSVQAYPALHMWSVKSIIINLEVCCVEISLSLHAMQNTQDVL